MTVTVTVMLNKKKKSGGGALEERFEPVKKKRKGAVRQMERAEMGEQGK